MPLKLRDHFELLVRLFLALLAPFDSIQRKHANFDVFERYLPDRCHLREGHLREGLPRFHLVSPAS